MDVPKRFCDGEHKFLFEIKEGCKVPCVKIFCWLILLRSQYLIEMLEISLTFKNSENVVKSGCSVRCLRWRALIFSQNESGI